MNALLQLFFHLASCLIATPNVKSVSGLSFNIPAVADNDAIHTSWYDPSSTYQGTAVVEVWIGEEPVNVGNVWGPALYREVQSALHSVCGNDDDDNGHCSATDWRDASFRTIYSAGRNQVQTSLTSLTIERASYRDALTRNILIAIIARTLQATVTNEQQNCYWENNIRFCNVGSLIRVNMHENGVKNYLHVRLHSEEAAKGGFECCDTLEHVDSAVNSFNAHVESVYGRYSRDLRCITEGFRICEGRVAGDD
ncbi:hypothetical protein J1614_000677 [Plenodomus biglobosus]|nr:hypothetical protein J1614_000677 [Plenodomus biglobosus]